MKDEELNANEARTISIDMSGWMDGWDGWCIFIYLGYNIWIGLLFQKILDDFDTVLLYCSKEWAIRFQLFWLNTISLIWRESRYIYIYIYDKRLEKYCSPSRMNQHTGIQTKSIGNGKI